MNITPWPLVVGMVSWTMAGTVALAAAALLNRSGANAALRNLAWRLAFAVVWLLPIGAIPAAREAAMDGFSFWTSGACATGAPGEPGSTLGYFLLSGWIGGMTWPLGRVLLAWFRVKRWYAQSADYPSGRRAIETLVGKGQGIRVRVALGDDPAAPITWGARRPVILLPKGAEDWSGARLHTVLCHELGHIRRYDNLAQVFAALTCAIHWCNPLFWCGARKMEAEAEMAADDWAILQGIKPSRYAAELLELATQFRSHWWAGSFAQTSMVQGSTVEQRVRSVLDPRAKRGQIGMAAVARVIAVFSALLIGLAATAPLLAAAFKAEHPPTPSCLPPHSP